MTIELKSLTKPQEVVEAAERIYNDTLKQELEAKNPGDFAAIDVITAQAYVAKYPEDAMVLARREMPTGLFHLVEIGSPDAFTVRDSANPQRSRFL